LSEKVSYKIIQRTDSLSNISQDSQYIEIIEDTLREEGFEFAIFPGSTDSKYIRAKGVNAYGISLFKNTPILAHDHNEFLGIGEYLRGVKMYEKLIHNLSNN
jgi:acetylornithine deacetylase/succinyl-diaminopimelate desuccinylase-like protein